MVHKYDFIIIGSGLGGLQCAVYLSDFGHNVLVLEKNKQVGGLIQSYNWKGCELSAGLHYLGGFDKGDTLYKIFDYLDLIKGIKYQKLDVSGFDIFDIHGKNYKYASGIENFKNQVISYFPNEKSVIDKYIDEVISAVKSQELYLLKPTTDTKKLEYYLQLNAWDFICSLTENDDLRQILSALNFVYAGEKEKTPFYVHALITYHFITGSYRIAGGTSQLANRLVERVRKNGGNVIANKNVRKIIIENNFAQGVITSDEDIYYGANIISNVHPAVTLDMIESKVLTGPFKRRLKKKENTISSFALHLKLKPRTFKYRNHNYNYHKNKDVWYASNYDSNLWPEHFFMHCHVPEDESEFATCVSILTHMQFSEVEKWALLPLMQRGDDYDEFKEQKAQKMIKLLISIFPELEGNITDYLISTPLTYRDYINTPQGSMYGTVRDYRNPVGSYISHKTKIDNLFFTGQNLNLHGILGVSLSSIVTCSEFIGLETLLNKINEKE